MLTAAEQKIEFLTRNIPGLRSGKKDAIEELETLFIKETITNGYRVLHQDKSNDYLHFIVSGKWRILYNYNSNKKLKNKFESLDESLPSLLLIGVLTKGDWFGHSSAMTRQKWKYSVQVSSDELVVYKILAQQFYDNFGKDRGAPIQRIRAKIIMDNNWIKNVIKRLQDKEVGVIVSEWEFVDKSHNPSAKKVVQHESPYLKKTQAGSISEVTKLEERKRMKEFLTAPIPNKKQQQSQNEEAGKLGNAPNDFMRKIDRDDMESKYKGVFGFGTPNIRPNKRMAHLNQDQIKSKISLQRLWGNVPVIPNQEKDGNNFLKASASDFLKRTRAAEIEMKHKRDNEESGSSNSDQPVNTEEIKPKKQPSASLKSRFNFE